MGPRLALVIAVEQVEAGRRVGLVEKSLEAATLRLHGRAPVRTA